MANIKNLSIVSAGDAILGDVMSNNFSQIFVAINSQAINSENYGVGNIESNHIAANAIVSQHFSDSTIGSAKISNSAVLHANVNFDVPNGGVRVARIGGAASDMPAYGLGVVRVSSEMAIDITDNAVYTIDMVWSDAEDEFNAFTATPALAGYPVFQTPASNTHAPRGINVQSLDSVSAKFYMSFSATPEYIATLTMHVQAIGAVSTV